MNPHIEINGTVFTPKKLRELFQEYMDINCTKTCGYCSPGMHLEEFLKTYNDEPSV